MSLAILAAFGQNTEGIGQFFLPLVHRLDNRRRWCCGRFHFRQRTLSRMMVSEVTFQPEFLVNFGFDFFCHLGHQNQTSIAFFAEL